MNEYFHVEIAKPDTFIQFAHLLYMYITHRSKFHVPHSFTFSVFFPNIFSHSATFIAGVKTSQITSLHSYLEKKHSSTSHFKWNCT